MNWKRQHKVSSLIAAVFIVLFCISGVVLNHRSMYSRIDVSRSLIPGYKYDNWNSGLFRGTLPLDSAKILIYGDGGVFLVDGDTIVDFNQGLPSYSDYRHLRNIVMASDSSLLAAGQYELYHRIGEEWKTVDLPLSHDERLTDVAVLGDSVIVLTRDHLFISPDGHDFSPVELEAGDDWDGRYTLFRYLWMLHTGQLWGVPGKVIVDIIGLTFVLLILMGMLFWLMPYKIRSLRTKGKGLGPTVKRMSFYRRWHIKIGVGAFVLLVFMVVTGWCLRPPLLIPFALTKAPGIEGTALSPSQPWKDKLRVLRFDTKEGDWLLVTNDGFYHVNADLKGMPKKIKEAPAVSVMGPTVFHQEADGSWLVGSLSGMSQWVRATNVITDYFTGDTIDNKPGPPFGKKPVAGYSSHLSTPIIVDYYDGVMTKSGSDYVVDKDCLPQPDELSTIPMSLWNLALEVHTGRIYNLFGLAPLIWIFFAGALVLWVLITGYIVRKKIKS